MPVNAIHPSPVAMSMGPRAPCAAASISPALAAFESATNAARDALPTSGSSPPQGGRGCFHAAWSRIRNAVVDAFPARDSRVEPSREADPSTTPAASREAGAASGRTSPVAGSRHGSAPHAINEAFDAQEDALTLSGWAESGEPPEDRARALTLIQQCLRNPLQVILTLRGLHLSAPPPEFPPELGLIDLAENRLRTLPAFPGSLRILDFHRNPIATWPELPPGLVSLNAAECGLGDMNIPLPARLRMLNLASNGMTRMPELPPGLMDLNVEFNQITSLPAGMESMQALRRVYLHGNPLDADTLARIHDWNGRPEGPTFILDRRVADVAPHVASDVARLQQAERRDAERPERTFEQYIARLKNSVDKSIRSKFSREVDAFSARVKLDKPLFERLCSLTWGADAFCNDRPLLTWFHLLMAERNAALEAGQLDGDPRKVVDTVRRTGLEAEVHRLADRIVQRQGPGFKESIETHLHLLTEVADLLPGKSLIRKGDWTDEVNSGVTPDDIAQARARLREMGPELREAAIDSEAWQNVLQRAYPKAVARAREKLAVLAANSDERAKAYLRTELPGSENDPEQQRQAAKLLLDRSTHAMWERLTHRYEKQHAVSLG